MIDNFVRIKNGIISEFERLTLIRLSDKIMGLKVYGRKQYLPMINMEAFGLTDSKAGSLKHIEQRTIKHIKQVQVEGMR